MSLDAAVQAIPSHKYRDATEQVSAYNSKMLVERRLRIPYIDGQTGVAQQDCHIFVSRVQRCQPKREGQLFSYPSRRFWIRKRPNFTGNNSVQSKTDVESEDEKESIPEDVKPVVNEKIEVKEETPSQTASFSAQEESNMDESFPDEELDAFDDAGDLSGEGESESDDEFQPSSKRRRRGTAKKAPPGKLNSLALKLMEKVRPLTREDVTMMAVEQRKKPYVCEICRRSYKSHHGLRHHYVHYNHDADIPSVNSPFVPQEEPPNPLMMMEAVSAASFPPIPPLIQMPVRPPPQQQPPQHHHLQQQQQQLQQLQQQQQQHLQQQQQQQRQHQQQLLRQQQQQQQMSLPPPPMYSAQREPHAVEQEKQSGRASPNPYCDFCLGDKTENKKTGQAEELLSCADCGRSGHPSCLQFTVKLTQEVKKYKWQCIECKSCCLCGTSDNDDQLLFCDECDRGYHMYCLRPPMTEPPEGHWCCKLCEKHTP